MENKKVMVMNMDDLKMRNLVSEVVEGQLMTIKDKLRHVDEKQVCMEKQLQRILEDNKTLKAMILTFQYSASKEMRSNVPQEKRTSSSKPSEPQKNLNKNVTKGMYTGLFY